MKLALSQVCTLDSTFEADVENFAAGQCRAIDIWLTKLETYLQSHSLEDVRRLLAQHEMTAPAASFQGGLLASQGAARQQAWELFRRRLDLCRDVNVGVLVIACDVPRPMMKEDIQRVQLSLQQAAAEAETRDMRLALEFQASAALGNNLQTAAAMVAEVGAAHLGVCLDAFHYHVGPSQPEDLELLDGSNLFHVQLCDLADTPRELASDADRILPGDGDIALQPIIQRLQAINYQGPISIELMNPQIWRVPSLQFGEIGMTALRKLTGHAQMDDG